jgi:hypothetical protein
VLSTKSLQFPAQEQVIQACADLIKSRIEGDLSALKRGQANAQEFIQAEQVFKGWLVNKSKKEEDADPKLEPKPEDAPKEEEDGPVQGSSMDLDCPPEDEPTDGTKLSKKAKEQAKKEIEEAINRVKPEAESDEKKIKPERILVLVGTYSIGKERIVKGLSKFRLRAGAENTLSNSHCESHWKQDLLRRTQVQADGMHRRRSGTAQPSYKGSTRIASARHWTICYQSREFG